MKKYLFLSVMGIYLSGHSQALLTSLKACYPFDCDGGANAAATGSIYDGTIMGNVTCANGLQGAANTSYQFGGTTADYIHVNSLNTSLTQGFSFSGWFYITSSSNQVLVWHAVACGPDASWALLVQNTGGPSAAVKLTRENGGNCGSVQSVITSANITLNSWHHVACYISNSAWYLWVDNVQTTPGNMSISNYSGGNGIRFGGNGSANPFTGKIDNARFYTRQLTLAEITDLYTNDPACNSQGGNPPPPACCLGNDCSSAPKALTTDYQIPLNNFNFNFTNPSNSPSKLMIGHSICTNGMARVQVYDDNIGRGIYSGCSTTGADNIAFHGNAGDPNSSTSTNIFGVLGEANLSAANVSGVSAGVAGFCGGFVPTFLPPGQNIGVYGNSIANGGKWAGYFDGDVQFNGMVWGSQYWWASDTRLKSRIAELGDVSSQLKKIKSYTYLYNAEEFKKRNFPQNEQIGFLAQELKETFPQLVTDDGQGYLGVNYVGFIPVLLQAHKEQQAQIEEQAATLREQQKQIDELKTLVTPSAAHPEKTTGFNNSQAITLSDAGSIVLNQNVPNPFAESTIITYNLPNDFTKAEIIFTSNKGVVLKSVQITSKGKGSITVYADDLSHGSYTYSLVVDGVSVDSKKMIRE